MKTQSWKHHGRVSDHLSDHETSWMIRPGSPGAWLAAFPQRRSIPGFILDVLGNMNYMNYMNWLESGYFMILHSKQAAQALMMVRVDWGRTCSYHIYPHIIRLCLKTWLTKLLWLIIVRPKKKPYATTCFDHVTKSSYYKPSSYWGTISGNPHVSYPNMSAWKSTAPCQYPSLQFSQRDLLSLSWKVSTIICMYL